MGILKRNLLFVILSLSVWIQPVNAEPKIYKGVDISCLDYVTDDPSYIRCMTQIQAKDPVVAAEVDLLVKKWLEQKVLGALQGQLQGTQRMLRQHHDTSMQILRNSRSNGGYRYEFNSQKGEYEYNYVP